jgi:hypothetical protein
MTSGTCVLARKYGSGRDATTTDKGLLLKSKNFAVIRVQNALEYK